MDTEEIPLTIGEAEALYEAARRDKETLGPFHRVTEGRVEILREPSENEARLWASWWPVPQPPVTDEDRRLTEEVLAVL